MSEGLKSRHVTFPRSWLGVQGLLGCEYSRELGASCWTPGMWAFCGAVGLWLRWSLLLQEPVSALGPLSLLPSYPALPKPAQPWCGEQRLPLKPPSGLISSTLSLLHQSDVGDALVELLARGLLSL